MGNLMPFSSMKRKPTATGVLALKSYTGEYDTDAHGYIRFLSDGILTVENDTMVDVFLVGGGAGGTIAENSIAYDGQPGGGGGNTETRRGVILYGGNGYPIRIGAGSYNDGGDTSAFGTTAKGGLHFTLASTWEGPEYQYPDGGCGGGGTDGNGGTDGGGGTGNNAGRGQGRTTRLFGEADGELFAGGGAGGASMSNPFPTGGEGGGGNADPALGVDGAPNTGGGGAGGSWYSKETETEDGMVVVESATTEPGKGGSGIVVIREAV